MPRVQIIESPGGERMVVLPLKDYEQLRSAAEDLGDVHAYDAAKRRLASGEDELLPATYANRVLDGENSVRVWREYRGLSVKELAERAGISAAYLSQLERGNRQGTLTTMKALAVALSLDLDDLA